MGKNRLIEALEGAETRRKERQTRVAFEISEFFTNSLGASWLLEFFVKRSARESRGFINPDGLIKRVTAGETLVDLGRLLGGPFVDLNLVVKMEVVENKLTGQIGLVIEDDEFSQVGADYLAEILGNDAGDAHSLLMSFVTSETEE